TSKKTAPVRRTARSTSDITSTPTTSGLWCAPCGRRGPNGATSGRWGRFSGCASVPGHRIRYLPWINILPSGGADRKGHHHARDQCRRPAGVLRMTRRVLVAGAGVAGLATARALRGAGFEVTVVERRPGAPLPGLGLNLPGNAVRALDALG